MEFVSIEKITRVGLDGASVVVHLWPEAPHHGRAPSGREHTIRLSGKATQQLMVGIQKLLSDPKKEAQLKELGVLPIPTATVQEPRRNEDL